MSDTISFAGNSVTVNMLGVTSASGFSNQEEGGLIGLAPNPMDSSYNLDLFMSNLVSQDFVQSATLGMAYFTEASG